MNTSSAPEPGVITGGIIGVDEAGKGDFFGPLVVAAFCAPVSATEELRHLGVRDSKGITDKSIVRIAEQLRAEYPHEILVINPSEYNARYELIKNLNHLLADAHAAVITSLANTCGAETAISDKFGKPELIEQALKKRGNRIDIRQIVRGEQIVQVAAASILARAAFVEHIEALGVPFGLQLPKGAAAHVDAAGREFVALHGAGRLRDVAKLHFKNYARATSAVRYGSI